ncbi:MAG: hypothetical protein EHM20_14800, partial [Alphaproteobacteria bacterium]
KESFKRAIELEEDFYLSYFGLARYYLAQNDMINGRKYLRKSLKTKPDFVEAIQFLALIDFYQFKIQAAIKKVEKIIAISPDYSPAYFMGGYFYLLVNKPEKAITYWDQLIKKDSTQILFYMLRGTLEIELNHFSDAIIDFQKAFTLIGDKDNELLNQNGIWLVGYRDFRLLMELLKSPRHNKYEIEIMQKIEKSICHLYTRDYQESLKALHGIPLDDMTPLIYFIKALDFENLQQNKNAIEMYQKALVGISKIFYSYIKMAAIYNEGQEYQKSIQAVNDFLKNSGNNRAAYSIRGYAFMKTAEYHKAIVDFNTYLTLDTNDYNIFYDRGICYQELDSFQLAITDFDKVLIHSPYDSYTMYHMAQCKLEMGDTVASLSFLIRIINNRQTDFGTRAYKMRADIYYSLNKFSRCLPDYTAVLNLEPTNMEVRIKRSRANYQLANYQQAFDDINQVINFGQPTAENYISRAMCLSQLGKIDEACNDYRIALYMGIELGEADGRFINCSYEK